MKDNLLIHCFVQNINPIIVIICSETEPEPSEEKTDAEGESAAAA